MIYATPQEQESKEPTIKELYQAIDPSRWYLGTDVKIISKAFIQKAYYQGIMQGAALAARPLQARIEGLEAWQDEAKKKLTNNVYKTIFLVACGVVSGYVTGIIIANVK